MIGIEFEKENEYDNFLKTIFSGIDLENYDLDFTETEIIDNKEKIIEKNELLNIVKQSINEKYYIIFLNFKIFPKGEKKEKVENYQDFLNSNCEFILLISDAVSVEMYFKDNYLKEQIIKNINSINIKFNIKTLENDGRYIMSVI